MSCIEDIPVVVPGSAEEQMREICVLLHAAYDRHRSNCFYAPPDGLPLAPSIISALQAKGYSVIPQNKYRVTWNGGTAVRGAMRRVYWIGVPGRK
jgi:hypothetical protein